VFHLRGVLGGVDARSDGNCDVEVYGRCQIVVMCDTGGVNREEMPWEGQGISCDGELSLSLKSPQ